MNIKLETMLSQQQTVSQKLIQSVNILQMSAEELDGWLAEMSLENPVMELTKKQPEEYGQKNAEKYQWISSHDEQNRYLYQKIETDEDDMQDWDPGPGEGESLQEHLREELLTLHIVPEEEVYYYYLIDSLDYRGYYTDSLDDFAAKFGLEEETARNMLENIQKLTPPGVGARNLRECLLIQLQRKGQLTDKLKVFVTEYLEDMAKNRLPEIASGMAVSLDMVKEYSRIVKSLEPRPGAAFSDNRGTVYITPDIVVVKFRGHFDILLNESLYPDIMLNKDYLQLYRTTKDEEARRYLEDKIRQTEWIRQCVAQRNRTLFNIAQIILEEQKEFFFRGPSGLKPFQMAEAAKMLSVHKSTISRAVGGKYLQCSWGVFPLRYFFPQPAAAETGPSGKNILALQIKNVIKELIVSERKKHPYSDQKLCELLLERGIDISRRTVAKYREELGIPKAAGRKEF